MSCAVPAVVALFLRPNSTQLNPLVLRVNVSALKIHMSQSAHEAIMAFPEFITECRGDISVKVDSYRIIKLTFLCVIFYSVFIVASRNCELNTNIISMSGK